MEAMQGCCGTHVTMTGIECMSFSHLLSVDSPYESQRQKMLIDGSMDGWMDGWMD